MAVVIALLEFAAGVAALIFGGNLLVRGAVAIAERLGVSALAIGLTVVAFGTSAPELALNLIAAAGGHTDLVFGNLIGACLANLGLILGVSALIAPIRVRASLLRRELPIALAAAAGAMALAFTPPGALSAVSLDGSPREWTHGFGRLDGLVLLGGFVCFVWLILRSARNRAEVGAALEHEAVEIAEREPLPPEPASWGMLAGGLALLVVGGKLAEMGAVGGAEALGVPKKVIGLTVVSIATTLPELVTCVVAVGKGQDDIALGNVLGSNVFNLLCILGCASLLATVPAPPGAAEALGALVVLSVLLFPISLTFNWTISRLEGAVLLLLYLAFMGWTVWETVVGR